VDIEGEMWNERGDREGGSENREWEAGREGS